MQIYENREGKVYAAVVGRTPRVADAVVLPAGLAYMNEFYGVRNVITQPTTVIVTARYGGEFCWSDRNGRTCSARFTVSA